MVALCILLFSCDGSLLLFHQKEGTWKPNTVVVAKYQFKGVAQHVSITHCYLLCPSPFASGCLHSLTPCTSQFVYVSTCPSLPLPFDCNARALLRNGRKYWWGIKFGRFSENCQTSKFKTPPIFPAIWYRICSSTNSIYHTYIPYTVDNSSAGRYKVRFAYHDTYTLVS